MIATSLAVLVAGALLLMGHLSSIEVYCAQFLIGSSGAFLAPTVAAITLGVVGSAAFDRLLGKIQSFNSAGNVFTALLVAYISYKFGYRMIFAAAAFLAIPAAIALFTSTLIKSTMPGHGERRMENKMLVMKSSRCS